MKRIISLLLTLTFLLAFSSCGKEQEETNTTTKENTTKQEEKKIKKELSEVDQICSYNSFKVLKAFQNNKVSEVHFNETTGYGYNDIGRETIENIFKDVLQAEDALVRAQLISGTHALAVTLSALLRPGEKMLSITGAPYDTLQTVIGITGNSKSSLKTYKIEYEQIDLVNNEFDKERICKRL